MGAMVQFRKWDDILSGQLPKPEKPRLLAWYHWARAIAQAEKGNLNEAKAESSLMKQRPRKLTRRRTRERSGPRCRSPKLS